MIQMLTSVIGQRGVDAMAFLLAFALTALTDSIFRAPSMWCIMCC